MTLSLPQDLGEHIPIEDYHSPAVYALDLSRPNDLASAWDREFDVRPPFFGELRDADGVVYVGATNDALGRLEDHRDGDVRQAALLQVCDIKGLRDVWLFDEVGRAFERESGIAIELANEHPDWFVKQS